MDTSATYMRVDPFPGSSLPPVLIKMDLGGLAPLVKRVEGRSAPSGITGGGEDVFSSVQSERLSHPTSQMEKKLEKATLKEGEIDLARAEKKAKKAARRLEEARQIEKARLEALNAGGV